MSNTLKHYLDEIWIDTTPYWQDAQSLQYYQNCILVLQNYIDELNKNNIMMEIACDSAMNSNSY